MFTDQELDILEIEILPIVTKYNDLQKVFDNLDEDYVDLFSKGCDYEGIDISDIAIGVYGRQRNNILYLRGMPTSGYQEYEGGQGPGRNDIQKVITKTKIILPENCDSMFSNCGKIELIEDTNLGNTSKVKNMSGMFNDCYKLENLDVSNGDTSCVEALYGTFDYCHFLSFLDVSNGDTSRVENMSCTFRQCFSLKEIKGVENGDISNVREISSIFNACKSLTKLDLSNGDTSNLIYIQNAFEGCTELITLNISNGDTSKVTDFSNIFERCKIFELDLSKWDTSKGYYMFDIFKDCSNLHKLDVSNGDFSNAVTIKEMFYGCTNLEEIKGILDWDINLVSLNKKNIFKNINPKLKNLRKIRSKFIRRS